MSSNEPADGDFSVVDPHQVLLRAERDGGGDGRVYTITVTCVNFAQKSASASTTVVVAHDQGRP